MASVTKDAIQQATVTASVRANAKQADNLDTFVAALMEILEYGMEGAPPECKQRVVTLRSELEQVQKLVEVYLLRHFNTLTEYSVRVRQLLLSNMNIGLHEGMDALCGAGRQAVQEAYLRCVSSRNR